MRYSLRWITLFTVVFWTTVSFSIIIINLQPTLAQVQTIEQQRSKALQLFQLGTEQFNKSQFQDALKNFQQALVIVKKIKELQGEAVILKAIGLVYDNQGQYSQALDFYNQALIIFKQLANKTEEGNILSNIGVIYDNQGKYSQALDFYNQALIIFKQIADKSGEGTTLNNIGAVYRNQGNYTKALEAYTQALALTKQIGNKPVEGSTLNNIGAVYRDLGEYAKALEFYQQALILRKQINDKAGEARTLNNIGAVYFNKGEYFNALEFHNQALVIFQQTKNQRDEGATLNNIGTVYDSLGEYAKALYFYQKSLVIRKQIGDKPGEGTTLNNIGLLYRNIGQDSKALNIYKEALDILQEIGDKAGEAITLGNIGVIYDNLGKYSEAFKFYNQALEIRKQIGDKPGEGVTLTNIAVVYYNQEKYFQSLNYLNQALDIFQKNGAKAEEGSTLNNIGAIYYKQKQYSQALDYYGKALVIQKQIANKAEVGKILSNIGNVYLKQRKYSDAEKLFLTAIEILDSVRDGLNDDQKISIFEIQTTAYRLLQETLIAQQKHNAALEVAERSRARAFIDLLSLKISQNSNNKNRDVTNRISTKALTIEKIQQIAQQQKATFVEYTINESQLYIWVIKPTGQILFKEVNLKASDIGISSVTDLVVKSRESIGVGGRGFDIIPLSKPVQKQNLKKLHQLLIEPIASFLPTNPNEHVIFIPHDSLFLVPFPALQDKDGKYLIQKHTILTSPAIQVLEFTKEQRQKLNNTNTLVVGNPIMPFVGVPPVQLNSLPFAEEEAKAIANLNNTTAIIGSQATKATFKQKLPSARIIHLATHGLLEDANKKDIPTGIVFAPESQNGKDGDDALLKPGEIIDLPINAELVVLSACDTGRGRITGDGVIGLSRSFIAAGASSVIVSLWSIPDDSTSELMTEFYQQLAQNPDKAAALRQAMLKTMKKYPRPVYWAAFTLIGETK
jgi:tetratricopeptide (TPR) repeat protein